MMLLFLLWLLQHGPEYHEYVAQAAISTGTRDAILGTIGGGDVAIMGVLYLIVRRMGEIRDELKSIHLNQQAFYREMSRER